MKKIMKKMTAVLTVLAMVLAMSSPAFAAVNNLSVTYKSKTVAIVNLKKETSASYATVKKAWGKPNKTNTANEYYTEYTYKKGKSVVKVIYNTADKRCSYDVTIQDKNMSLSGIKVGMTKAQAEKVFAKSFDGKYTDSKETMTYSVECGGYMPIQVTYNKAGKITKIWFFCS